MQVAVVLAVARKVQLLALAVRAAAVRAAQEVPLLLARLEPQILVQAVVAVVAQFRLLAATAAPAS